MSDKGFENLRAELAAALADAASARARTADILAKWDRAMAPLRKVCRCTEDESPVGCVERLIEERDEARKENERLRRIASTMLDALHAVESWVNKTRPMCGENCKARISHNLWRKVYDAGRCHLPDAAISMFRTVRP